MKDSKTNNAFGTQKATISKLNVSFVKKPETKNTKTTEDENVTKGIKNVEEKPFEFKKGEAARKVNGVPSPTEKVTKTDCPVSKKLKFEETFKAYMEGRKAISEADAMDVDPNAPDANLDGAGFDEAGGDMTGMETGDEDVGLDLDDPDALAEDDDTDETVELKTKLKMIMKDLKSVISQLDGEEDEEDLEDDENLEDDLEDTGEEDIGMDLDATAEQPQVPAGAAPAAPAAPAQPAPMGESVDRNGKRLMSGNKVAGKIKAKKGRFKFKGKQRDASGRLTPAAKSSFSPTMSKAVSNIKGKNEDLFR